MAVIQQAAANPLSNFIYALKAPETKRQWPNRLKIVFRFLGLGGDHDDQARQFVTLYRDSGMAVVHEKLTSFISYQIQRAQKKEISQATIPNYLKAVKLFCDLSKRFVTIHPSLQKLIVSIRTAIVIDDWRLDKSQTSYNDVLDSFRLALCNYELPKNL